MTDSPNHLAQLELPEPHFQLRWRNRAYFVTKPGIENCDVYTADQMRAYAQAAVLAERERCARVAEEFRRGAGDPVCGQVAAAIRDS